MEFDRYVSAVTRRISYPLALVPGGVRLLEPFRRFYAARYRGKAHAAVQIADFDHDLRLVVDRSAYIASCIYWRGFHQLHELLLLDRLLKPEHVFVDVGANQGEFAVFAAKRLSRGRVLAFEPVKALYDQLTTNISLNSFSNVQTFNYGLSDAAADVDVYTSEDVKVEGSFHEGLATMYQTGYRSSRLGSIHVERLDDVLQDVGVTRVDAIKIDVEGAELAVLRGAEQTLRRFKPTIIMEINDETSAAAGYTTSDIVRFLQTLGYSIALVGRGGRVVPFEGGQLPALCNIVCSATAGLTVR